MARMLQENLQFLFMSARPVLYLVISGISHYVVTFWKSTISLLRTNAYPFGLQHSCDTDVFPKQHKTLSDSSLIFPERQQLQYASKLFSLSTVHPLGYHQCPDENPTDSSTIAATYQEIPLTGNASSFMVGHAPRFTPHLAKHLQS